MKKIFSLLILSSVITLSLVGCKDEKKEIDNGKPDNESHVSDKVEKIKVNDLGLEVFDINFSKSIELNPDISPDDLENEFILFTYSETCKDCVSGAELINTYVSKKDSLPVYALDFTKPENKEILNYLISKGLNYTNISTFSYFYNGDMYKNTIGEFTVGDIPLKGNYKSLKVMEQKSVEEDSNSYDQNHDEHKH